MFKNKITPRNGGLLEMLTGSLLDKKLAAFYGTECSLPQLQEPATCPYPEPDQPSPCPPSPFLKIHFKIILPSTPGSSLRFPHQNPVCTSPLSHTCYMACASHYSWFDDRITFGEECRSLSSPLSGLLDRFVNSTAHSSKRWNSKNNMYQREVRIHSHDGR